MNLQIVGLALAILASQTTARRQACENKVFAHLIIGNTYNYTQQDFLTEIQIAHAAGIDGFALNFALPVNFSSTDLSLNQVYSAAEQYGNGFGLFLSFDYGVVPNWEPSVVISYINRYSSSPAQYRYKDKPFVSTFEGPDHASDWEEIKAQTGCFFIPDYSSKGAVGAAALPNVDGLLSWDAWPEYTNDVPTTDQDVGYAYLIPGPTLTDVALF